MLDIKKLLTKILQTIQPIGTVLTANPAPSAVSCASGKYYQVASQTITAGTWIISATAQFPATNATGYRDMYCTTSSFSNGTTTAPANWGLITRCVIPAGNFIEFARATFPVTLSSGTLTFRVVAHHSANTNIDVTGRIYATRIK